MEEAFIEKPVGTPVKRYKARVSEYDNGVKVIAPQAQGESNRRMIKQKGKSSFYKSEGEKESSYSIHINVDANDPDPVATMQERAGAFCRTHQRRAKKRTETAGEGQAAL